MAHKNNTIGKAIKEAVKATELIASRDHSDEEYFTPFGMIMDMIDIRMDLEPKSVYESQWAQAFVVASFEHAIDVIAHSNASMDPD